jgi:hypothetical protein
MKYAILLVLVVLGAINVDAQKVKVSADPNTDLSRYKTYRWADGVFSANPRINQTLIDAVDSALASKGLSKVTDDPQLTVSVWSMTESDLHTTYQNRSNPLGLPGGAGAVASQSWPVTTGTLVVGLTDAQTKNSVWRGSASATLSNGPSGNPEKDAKNVEKPIRKAVQKMFKQYPKPS